LNELLDEKKSLTGPHSELNLVQVVIGEFAHRHTAVEFSYNFFLRIQEQRADTVEVVIVKVTTERSLAETRRAICSHILY
jgi:hypothetical protein